MTAQIIDFAQKKREREERMLQIDLTPEEVEFIAQHIQFQFIVDAKTHDILSSGEKDKE